MPPKAAAASAEVIPEHVLKAREQLRARMGNGAQVGGKGSMRRKSAPVEKANSIDEKKLGEAARKAQL